MFEFDQPAVQELLKTNADFKTLYDRHEVLRVQVAKAEKGPRSADKPYLNGLKKEKLMTKDRMAALIEAYRGTQSA